MNPKLQAKLISYPASYLLSLISITNRHQHIGRDLFPLVKAKKKSFIFAVWHNRLILPLHIYRNVDLGTLASYSKDGEFVAQGAKRFGFVVYRGSSSRQGATGLTGLNRHLNRGNSIVMTPDGPRGPRECLQMGVIHLAKTTGLPVTPVGISCSHHKRLNTWDRFVIPLPFGKIVTVVGEDIHIPPQANDKELEHYRQQVELSLREATRTADETTGMEILPYPTK